MSKQKLEVGVDLVVEGKNVKLKDLSVRKKFLVAFDKEGFATKSEMVHRVADPEKKAKREAEKKARADARAKAQKKSAEKKLKELQEKEAKAKELAKKREAEKRELEAKVKGA